MLLQLVVKLGKVSPRPLRPRTDYQTYQDIEIPIRNETSNKLHVIDLQSQM